MLNRTGTKTLRVVSLLVAVLLPCSIAACSTSIPKQTDPSGAEINTGVSNDSIESQTADVVPAPLTLEDVTDTTWVVEKRAEYDHTNKVPLNSGSFELAVDGETVSFTIGDYVAADLNSDGVLDLAVELRQRPDTGLFHDEWYLWIADVSGPIQVLNPIARSTRCGAAVVSVTADDGGVEVVEYTRTHAEKEARPCIGVGSQEERRTISAVWSEELKQWWPMRIRPAQGFGGVCPGIDDDIPHIDTGEFYDPLYAIPDDNSKDLQAGYPIRIVVLDSVERWLAAYPNWRLLGIADGGTDNFRCAWVTTN